MNASHELKTPLTILHGTLEQMLSDNVTPPAHRERISSMLEEVQRLAGIVGQLTFLAKADAGLLNIECEPLAFDFLVRDLSEDAIILAASADISVNLSPCDPVVVNGDRMRLRQVLLNLVDNAVKYNEPGGSIEMSLRKENDKAVFAILNTGPALSPELRERVFDRFFRGDPAHNGNIEGSGLGLSIARSIVEAHRGYIGYDVLPDGSNRVMIVLPVHRQM